jgi:hypothetical protein
MSDYGSTRTHRTSGIYRSTAAVRLWWNTGHRRSNSDTASVISRRNSNRGKTSNRLSVPYILPYRHPRPCSPPYIHSPSFNDFGDAQRNSIIHHPVDESAVSDTSLEEPHDIPDDNTMAERGVRQSDRAHIVNPDDRRERPRNGRNPDIMTVSSSTLTPEPSLFEACRELQRRNVRVSFPSIFSIPTSSNATTNNQGRQVVPIIDRATIPSYPDHLLNLPAEPSFRDICLKTALNAGASIEFIPRTPNAFSSSSDTFTCEDCNRKCSTEQDWDTHVSREKSYCAYCDGKFECHGQLLKHNCSARV